MWFHLETYCGTTFQVGHGDVITVRVPTHEGGSCLYWEFATDNFDLGFGVYFEWGKPTTNEVSVIVCESDDDDEDDEEGSFFFFIFDFFRTKKIQFSVDFRLNQILLILFPSRISNIK